MKVLHLYGPMEFHIDEAPEPSCGPGQVKLRTRYAGLCGSDRPRALEGQVPFFPNTLGHEFSGEVVAVGEGVSHVRPGDLAAIAPLIVCGSCPHCRTGHYGQCLHKQFIGLRVPETGGFAEYNVLPAQNVLPVPQGMDGVSAALAEPASVALHALSRAELRPGEEIAVIGAGTIGLLIVQAARALGARRIHVFDCDEASLRRAAACGADACYHTAQEGFLDDFLKATDGLGCPAVLEAVGVQQTVSLALQLCRVAGRVALVGYLDRPLAFTAEEVRRILEQELVLRGVWQSYDLDYPGDAWRLGLELLAEGKLGGRGLIDRIIPASALPEALADWKEPGKLRGKIVLDFTNGLSD